jgi:AAA15 family ATPase/GTPase
MLTEIKISNFKSIEKIEQLPLKPLTILTGKNSSGKSNIMEAISFFGQGARWIKNLRTTNSIEDVFTHGDVIKYPYELKDFIPYKREKERIIELEIGVKPDDFFINDISEEIISKNYNGGFLQRQIRDIKSVTYGVSFRISGNYYSQNISINSKTILKLKQEKGKQPIVSFPPDFRGFVTSESLSKLFSRPVLKSGKAVPNVELIFSLARKIVSYINDHSERIYFISGERGEIQSAIDIKTDRRGTSIATGYESEVEHPSWIGFNGQHLIDILSICFTSFQEKGNKIKEWSKKFQLPEIYAGYVGKGRLEANFKDGVTKTTLNSILAGLGSRQILSIITQIFWSDLNDIILIEEPEMSLHPENQVLLHELFAEAISQGKQIICSTHSPFFILALSRIIKKKLLNLDDIAVYEIEKGTHGTKHKELKLNKHGFIDGGIPTFMKVEEELFKDWSESLEE